MLPRSFVRHPENGELHELGDRKTKLTTETEDRSAESENATYLLRAQSPLAPTRSSAPSEDARWRG
jgi:hypothetical protein